MNKALAWSALPARLLAGGALAAAGFIKLMGAPEEFAMAMEAYRLVPVAWLLPIARVAPWLELWAGVFLVMGCFTRQAALATAVAYGVFLTAIGSTLARGIALENCGCFGRSLHLAPWQAMALDGVLLLLAVLAWRDRAHYLSLDRWMKGSPPIS